MKLIPGGRAFATKAGTFVFLGAFALALGAGLLGGTTNGRWRGARAAAPRGDINNEAYVKIKGIRQKHVDRYAERLFELAEACATLGAQDPGTGILATILQLYEPPRNRRKTEQTGVALDEAITELAARLGPDVLVVPDQVAKLKRVRQKELTPEEKARLEEVRARVKALRVKITAGASAPQPSDEVAKENERELKKLVRRLGLSRRKFVGDMVRLAQQCLKQNFPAHGYEVILWALPFDPEHKTLRKALGQGRFKKDGQTHWLSAYELRKIKQGYRLHPDYGWVTPVELKNLEKGYLWYSKQRKWLPREEVEALRQEWENAWVHETEHFEVTTNAPLRDVVLFGREIERFYRFFFRVFVDYYTPKGKIPDAKLVFGGGLNLGKEKLQLNYYASRESYLKEVKNDKRLQEVPNIGLTARSAGFYWGGNGRAYFYRGPEGPDLTVIYHEVTHQIFGETTTGRGPRAPVWMVEALGVFMEDPVIRGDPGTERLLAGAEPPPGVQPTSPRDINDFVKHHQTDDTFHGAGRGGNYAVAGAVAHFFLLYEGGQYRKGFLRYCREAYRNYSMDSPVPISKLYDYIGMSEVELQKAWKDFNAKPHLFDF